LDVIKIIFLEKNLVIKLYFSLRLNMHDSTILLKSAGYSFSNIKFDLIIPYALIIIFMI
jgi:hypothetical protein